MYKQIYQGRLGNLLLQNIGMSILSKKFNLKAENYSFDDNQILELKLHRSGKNQFSFSKKYYDADLNYLLFDISTIDHGIIFDGTYQKKEFIIKHKEEILNHFNLINYQKNEDEVFVHIRLDDVANLNPGYQYYDYCLSNLKCKKIYVCSDSFYDPIVQKILKKYDAIFLNIDPVDILNFAKKIDNLILSKGSFSWWCGILSQGKNIFYPIGDTPWYGDIFVFDKWHAVDITKLNKSHE